MRMDLATGCSEPSFVPLLVYYNFHSAAPTSLVYLQRYWMSKYAFYGDPVDDFELFLVRLMIGYADDVAA